MIHKELTRRKFLKTVGIGSFMLATSPLFLIPRPSFPLKILNVFPIDPEEESFSSTDKCINVGDNIQFIPSLGLEKFFTIDGQADCFNHIIFNVYEFTFRPILKYSEPCNMVLGSMFPGDTEKKAESYENYLINISSMFIARYDRLKLIGEADLAVGQRYRGYGEIRNTWWSFSVRSNSALTNRIETLKLNARVENILDYNTFKNTGETNRPRQAFYSYNISDISYNHDECLCDMHYYDDFGRFKNAAASHKNHYRTNQTNEDCRLPIYRLRIL